jgi:cholesterol transport system auxiliary component
MSRPNSQREGRRQVLRALLAPPLASLAAACEAVVPGAGPPPILYRLTPKSTFREDLPSVRWQLVLELPLANAGLSTTRIALYRNPTNLEYYARASWTDRAPSMVLTLMIESFENSGRIVAVGRDAVGLRSDFVLKSELREFQCEYFRGEAPSVHVAINAKLVQSESRTIVGSRSFDSQHEARADRLDDIIEAFDEALGKSLKKLVEWTLMTGDEAYRKRRGS